ncbi:3-oxoacyl-[acyl-carrier-protein] reductase [Halanaerobium sp. ST460_2HS_T2]|uniref:3-oxoacyl-[acyl-carrier-protein] reductase n=1 Tax=Halanaerobium sp. ST460_2HS_T2 TaxID=2183914 RepID=UPI000DF3E3B8|nr:3-oxoacyl-[acyl-carrier-protein] reductase [Halanaerobium sp. ST460_2HS_T2]RCW61992.1 3-oxoacyl-[acyl-carrier-protein] reductase [Halanaerobium sp. ST460_2HS_T2]
MNLKNKKVLITGSSRGIGAEIAKKMAALGAEVVINYANSQARAEGVKNEIEAAGGRAHLIQADVSNFEQASELVKTAYKKMGGLNVLVNNAGITKDKLILRMKEEDWDQVLDINLKGVFNCTKNAVRYLLKAENGKLINLSSVVGVNGNAGQANYSAAKAGIIGFTKTMAKELASKGVCSNAIAPGFIDTEMTDELKESIKEGIIEQVPLARFGKAEEVADLVSFLASDSANYINGEVIKIDGGMGA